MINKQSRKQLLKRLETLDEHTPRRTPFIVFINNLDDDTVESVEHIRMSGKGKGVKMRKKIITTTKEFDNYLEKMFAYPKCVVITGEEDLED